MQLRFGLFTVLSVLSLAGCSSLSIDNGSLDYKTSSTTAPLKYPEGTMVRPATPLYPAPSIEQRALEHAPKVENGKGNRFALPRPEFMSTTTNSQNVVDITLGRPQALIDGNKNPLLKIDGPSSAIWQYLIATLNSLNYNIISQDENRYQTTIKVDETTYVLKMTPLGNSYSIALFNIDNSFADPKIAAEILAQIYQNWPA
ncbi:MULTISPECIES: lipoprotein-34 precursor (NlpB) [unclassified Acinetobacter]|uniref:lipoprotein-34 precursor (NlpB) n=1 Tax=unclassified Acinetobacter TaxID=196816 RepID=UPI002934E7CB|nr:MULTISPECIES: lipoprotein-34 precursor (NlpB) [unclassified Acinetobacter]WOE30785.1 lipoprotein-34 precursor (NlpB) [Acinetobacter sp. SAAs470]WOE38978.1 lipoprotein-34 precursor (NlpB) [Acinetobacter sp. SAAs474]